METKEKRNLGRPPKWETVEELQEKIDEYFLRTPFEEQTVTGLALYLDTNRQTLMNYEEKDEFADVVKRAKLRIENVYELDLRKKGGAGAIFALKNFDWHDRQEIEQKQKTEVSFASEKAQKIADEYEEKLRDEL